jgi:hypothetical protein
MHPIHFEGAIEIKKPSNMTDEQCYSVWAKFGLGTIMTILEFEKNKDKLTYAPPDILFPGVVAGTDISNHPYYMTAWKPNKEDLDALNRGEPIYIKTLSKGLPPMAVFTLDENHNGNF